MSEASTTRAKTDAQSTALDDETQIVQNLLNNISDIIWTTDLELNTTYVSGSVTKLTGFSPAEYLNLKLTDCYTPESVLQMQQVFMEELSLEQLPETDRQRVRTLEAIQYRKDGNTIWVSMNISFIRDARGKAIGLQGISHDISRIREAQKKISDNEKLVRMAFQNFPDGFIAIHGLDYRFTYAEGTGLGQLGLSSEMMIGKHPRELFPPELTDSIESSLRDGFSGVSKTFDIPWQHEQFKATTIPMMDDSSQVISVMVIITIYTKRKKIEDDLSRHQQILASIVDTQQEMICRFMPDSTLTFVNQTYCHVMGYSEKELLGKRITTFMTDSQNREFESLLRGMSIENQSAEFIYHSINPEHPEIWQEWMLKAIFDDNGQIVEIQAVGRDITERKQTEETQLIHNRFQQIVAEVSASFVSAEIDSLNHSIDQMLESFAVFFEADRAYLFRYNQDMSRMSNVNEWCKAGIISQKAQLQDLPAKAFPWWHEKIMAQDIIQIPDTAKLPSIASNEIKEFGRQQIKSLVAIPVISKDKCLGFFGFDCVTHYHEWNSIQANYLKLIANLIAEVLHKHAIEQDLINQNQLYGILSKIAQHYINLPSEKLIESINSSLEELALFSAADRAYIFDYDWQNNICNNTHEWCAPGITPQIDELQGVPLDIIIWWTQKHKKGEALYIEDVYALSEDDGVRQILEPQDVKSLITLPIMNGEECTGFVGFDSVRAYHCYSEKEQQLLTFFAQLVVNVTNRIELENELRQEKINADAANRAKSEFLANMSHEIRTPLNGVIGFSELIMRTKLDKAQQQYSQNIISSGYTLLGVINDILDFSKIESGKLELDIVKTDIMELVGHSADIIKIQSSQKGLEFLLNIAPDLPRLVKVDPLRLNQILVNLLANAVKFTQEGELELKLSFNRISSSEGIYTFCVRDTGIGISNEQKNLLFKAFSQADTSTSRKYGGTGLGLVIANTLANMMGSKIELKSIVGQGSEFFFKLQLEYEKTDEEQHHAGFNGIKRVLIIDDNVNNRTILQNILSFWGLEVTLCDSGISALKLWAEAEPFDVVIVDYNMPILDGLETIRMLLNQKNTSLDKAPAILLHSSSDDAQIYSESKKMGVDHVLVKPVKINDMYKCLSRISDHNLNMDSSLQEGMPEEDRGFTLNKQATILIAEDNDMNLALIQELLSIIIPDARLFTAVNGIEALKIVDMHQPYLIFMDIQMPELDGIATTKIIRANPNKVIAETPIIALTAGALNHERTRCLEAGMNDFLTKPVLSSDINLALKRFLLEHIPKGDKTEKNILTSTSTNHFDHHKLLNNLSKDVDVFRRILTISRGSFPDKINKLGVAIHEGNDLDIVHLAHSIKGSAMNLYFLELARIATSIETEIGMQDKEKLESLLQQLREEWSKILEIITEMI